MNDIKSWEQIKQGDTVKEINKLLEEYPDTSLAKIETDVLKITKGIISNYLKRKGYKMIKDGNKRYYEEVGVIQSNIDHDKSNIKQYKSNIHHDKSNIRPSKNDDSNLYFQINKYLQDSKDKKMVAKTIKLKDDNDDKITKFLEKHLILNKQDVINLAIEMFLDKYGE